MVDPNIPSDDKSGNIVFYLLFKSLVCVNGPLLPYWIYYMAIYSDRFRSPPVPYDFHEHVWQDVREVALMVLHIHHS